MEDNNNNSFLGQGWSFPPEFNPYTAEVDLVAEDQDILESLNILLSTNPGERIMLPQYGIGIRQAVFQTIDQSLVTYLEHIIRMGIVKFETRIELNAVNVDVADVNQGVLYITVDYTVRKTNTRSNMVYPFYLEEGTNIPKS